eukprot:m.237762 g.237762  ORF g.237762 m.237762 type:complete len:890 (-) comp17113_c1_seq9:1936-4605(-)
MASVLRSLDNAANVQPPTKRIISRKAHPSKTADQHKQEHHQQLLWQHEDLVRVAPLTEEAVVNCLADRFASGLWYSLAGPTLLAVNPYTNDNPVSVVDYKARVAEQGTHCAPHIYTIAERALEVLPSSSQQQVIVLSGQSGAGKTFSSNLILDYLTHCAGHEETTLHPVITALTASSCLLEAFGNARTVNNRNSSRFGKYIDLHFSHQKSLEWATIKTYLLETSRVTSQQATEQNFHIFHYIAATIQASAHLTQALMLDGHNICEMTRYLPPTDEDLSEFTLQEVLDCMSNAGMDSGLQDAIVNALCAVLALGCVKMNDITDANTPSKAIERASALLGISPVSLHRFFKYNELQCGAERILKPRHADAVETTIDAFSRFLYRTMFDLVVATINTTLRPQESGTAPSLNSIGLLDIFGFEVLNTNTLEQLCINFVNEKLQKHFVQHMIEAEYSLYTAEGLAETSFLCRSNSDCMSLLYGAPASVFSLLDESCKLKRRRSQDGATAFSLRCVNVLGPRYPDHFQGPSMKEPASFVIKHYAGCVRYDAQDMPIRNQDVNSEVFSAFCQNSGATLLQWVTSEHEASTTTGKSVHQRKHATVTSSFIADINSLFQKLEDSRVHYIRCVSSNTHELPLVFDEKAMKLQLRAGGIIDSLRVFAAGRPVHMPYQEFVNTYWPILSRPCAHSERAIVEETITLNLDVAAMSSSDKPLYGRTMVFLKDVHVVQLHTAVEKKRDLAATCLQSLVRGCMSRFRTIELRRKRRERAKAEAEAARLRELAQLERSRQEKLRREKERQKEARTKRQQAEQQEKPQQERRQQQRRQAEEQGEQGEQHKQETLDPSLPTGSAVKEPGLKIANPASHYSEAEASTHLLPRSVLRHVYCRNTMPLPPM